MQNYSNLYVHKEQDRLVLALSPRMFSPSMAISRSLLYLISYITSCSKPHKSGSVSSTHRVQIPPVLWDFEICHKQD